MERQRTGRWGEHLAAVYLEARGYQIIDRNVRTPFGELDLITRKENVTVFVEVKTRTNDAFGLPEGSITKKKQTHLYESAQAYLQSHPELDGDWRIDVIAIQGKPGDKKQDVVWFENVIS